MICFTKPVSTSADLWDSPALQQMIDSVMKAPMWTNAVFNDGADEEEEILGELSASSANRLRGRASVQEPANADLRRSSAI